MRTYTDKRPTQQSQSKGSTTKYTHSQAANSPDADNRTGALQLRSLQDLANKHSKTTAFQLADNRPEAAQMKRLQGLSNSVRQRPKVAPAPHADGRVVQRLAFVDNRLIKSDKNVDLEKDLGFTPNMLSLVEDGFVRDFKTTEELRQYAQGKTDYIGNILAPQRYGVWVRFPKGPGTALLGESHDKTILAHITKAIGTDSFAHERFTDAQEYGERVARQDRNENQQRLTEHGVGREESRFLKHSLESLKAKTAFVMNIVVREGFTQKNLEKWTTEKFNSENSKTHSDAYIGKPIQTYLKYAWAIMTNLKKAKGLPMLTPFDGFDWNAASATFALIQDAPAEGLIGDVQGMDSNIVQDFAVRFLKMSDIIMGNSDVLKNYKSRIKNDDDRTDYMLWRDAFIMDNIKKLPPDVRYLGMGETHRKNLNSEISQERNVILSEYLETLMNAFEQRTNELGQKI
ncbi:hypothetical protein [Parachryseolinea silvisoli]|uniref:hypothetical protein n=1 Tax=Parachryseolinea silvisoli TaxID=2873601 RepID=UPI002265B455|nr:hypothetical protein [Parachryseolinea silvisoli]MCD9020117.1 hypothetical protein [Parachryseolinea silvisoli]